MSEEGRQLRVKGRWAKRRALALGFGWMAIAMGRALDDKPPTQGSVDRSL